MTLKKTSANLNRAKKEYRTLSKTQVKKRKAVDDDLSTSEIETLERIESGKGRFTKFKNAKDAIEWLHNQPDKKE
jgi:predicted ATP-binding protein involved in virulence